MPPFTLHPRVRLPVLISVPHAGRDYPAALLAAARLPVAALSVLEDPLVDRLIAGGIAAGASAIVAHAPRAQIDLNRSLDDLDPGMIAGSAEAVTSRRAAAGLGLIPRRLVGQGKIWRRSLAPEELQRRIALIHRPYHDAIAAELARLRAMFGIAVLLDCHSMPSRGGAGVSVVLGDRHGTTAAAFLVEAAEAACAAHGVASVRNEPYAGGEIVTRHGCPARGIHAVQVELDRNVYLAGDLRSPGPGFGHAIRLMEAIVRGVAEAAHPAALSLAAE